MNVGTTFWKVSPKGENRFIIFSGAQLIYAKGRSNFDAKFLFESFSFDTFYLPQTIFRQDLMQKSRHSKVMPNSQMIELHENFNCEGP